MCLAVGQGIVLPRIHRLLCAACVTLLLHCGSDTSSEEDANITLPPRAAEPPSGEPADVPIAPASAPMADPLPDSPPGQWTWFGPEHFGDVPRCMDGSTTGLGVNRSPAGSKKVLVFMQGGGACFTGQTCAISNVIGADHHDEQSFARWTKMFGAADVMNRERADNPFRDWNLVMLPYCSGDVFAGDNEAGFRGRPQLGYKNVTAYLPRLVSTFRESDQLVLTGMSAGGYGAVYDFVQFQNAFTWLDITMIDDSGPVFATTYTPLCLQQQLKEVWRMDKTAPVEPFPLGVDPVTGAPGSGLRGLFQMILDKYPKNKFAFISHAHDIVMRYFHGIGHTKSCAGTNLLSASFYEEGLRDIRTIAGENFSTFYGSGSGHPYFAGDDGMYDTTVDGITLAAWLGKVVTTKDEPRRVPAQF